MKNLVPGEGDQNPSWSARLTQMFYGVRTPPRVDDRSGSGQKADPASIIPPEDRKATMRTLDATEFKLSLIALVLAAIVAIAVPAYVLAENKVTKAGKNSIAVAPDALLLGGLILLLCIIGFLSLWKRRRTPLTFALLLVGLAMTPFIQLAGIIFIFLGGWLMLRAWRINRYGTTNAKLIARQAREQPRGRDRKQTSGSSKTPPRSGERKPPAASKRYTPKSAPRKKIPKPASKPAQ